MPSSASESIPYLIEFAREVVPYPQRILDIGMGFGKLGFLIREYFEAKEFNRFTKEEWTIDLVGIEIFEPYLSDLQEIIYNKIIIGDVFQKLGTLGKFDLALLGDIIEHFDKDSGYRLLNQLLDHTRYILITTPNGFLEHGASGKNEHEEHKSGWTLQDFERFTVVKSQVIPRIRKDEEIIVVMLQQ